MIIYKRFKTFLFFWLLSFLLFIAVFVCLFHFDSIFLLCLSIVLILFLLFLFVLFKIKIKKHFKKTLALHSLAEVGKISFGIYHDLANILSASSIAVEEFSIDSDKKEQIVAINSRALSLLKSFKNQCKKESLRSKLSLHQEIDKILLIFNFIFIKNNIKLEKDFSAEKDLVFIDPIKFSRAIFNLINNAVESFDDSISNKVIYISSKNEGDNILISIKDSGIGISSDNINNVFQPYFSLKKKENCGIGLSVVKTIIENDFSGKISIESSLGLGSSFIISLAIIK